MYINKHIYIYCISIYIYIYMYAHILLTYSYRRKNRSQTFDLWTDAATVVRAVRDDKETAETESEEKNSEMREKVEKF